MDLSEWIEAWTAEARYPGESVPQVDERIEKLRSLWNRPVHPDWLRSLADDAKWPPVYRRGDAANPSPEHAVELEILGSANTVGPGVRSLGEDVIDGVNAIPLTRAQSGTTRRASNVEADLLLLTEADGNHRLHLLEAKAAQGSDSPWYAAVELLRQLRLFTDSPARELLRRRALKIGAPLPKSNLDIQALVLAPAAYYARGGKIAAAISPARRALNEVLNGADGLQAELAVWHPERRAIEPLLGTA